MADISLVRKNELYAHVRCEDHVLKRISRLFTFKPHNFKYMPSFKRGIWDGNICLVKGRLLPIGLIGEMQKWAQSEYLSVENAVEAHDYRKALDHFIEHLHNYAVMEPYDYQLEAFKKAIEQNDALILSPTGSGKSFIIFMMIAFILHYTDMKVLITTPRVQLAQQLYSDFETYANEGFSIEKNVGRLFSGEKIDPSKRVLISTWQSVYKKPDSFFHQFGAYICDEAHEADAESTTSIINKLQHTSKIRVGLTGSLDGTKMHAMQIMGLFGETVTTLTTRELIDEGLLSNIAIKVLMYRYQCKVSSKFETYKDEVDFVVFNEGRAHATVALAMTRNHNTLVLFNYKKHGHLLFDLANQLTGHGKELCYISGDTPLAEREQIRKKFETQNNIVLFASVGTFSLGINAPNIHHLILAHPVKSQIPTLQSIGRALRKAENKNIANVYDIADMLYASKRKKSFIKNHVVSRLEVYESQQFDYIMLDIPIK